MTSFHSEFLAYYPPEAGCIGYDITDSTVEARVTTLGRQFIARSIADGTSFLINEFAVGTGGYNPSYPTHATAVVPSATALDAEIYRAALTTTEEVFVNGTAKSYVARIGTGVQGGIGEIGLFAEILYSPNFPGEVGSQFLFCIAHQPLNTKTVNHVATYRIVVAY